MILGLKFATVALLVISGRKDPGTTSCFAHSAVSQFFFGRHCDDDDQDMFISSTLESIKDKCLRELLSIGSRLCGKI